MLFAQRDLRDARVVLIDTKTEQLSAIVNTYQALGGGVLTISTPADFHGQFPYTHTVRSGENFRTISLLYYRSSRYCKALWAANKNAVPDFDRLAVGDKILIPRVDQLDPALIEEVPAPAAPAPRRCPRRTGDLPALPPPPPPAGTPGPFGQEGTKDPADQSHRRHQTPRGLAEAGDGGEVIVPAEASTSIGLVSRRKVEKHTPCGATRPTTHGRSRCIVASATIAASPSSATSS